MKVIAEKSKTLQEDMVLCEIESVEGEKIAMDDIETVCSDSESISSDEDEGDDEYELDEELPPRALDTFAAMRNGIIAEHNIGIDIGADRISVSDVYAFDHEGD